MRLSPVVTPVVPGLQLLARDLDTLGVAQAGKPLADLLRRGDALGVPVVQILRRRRLRERLPVGLRHVENGRNLEPDQGPDLLPGLLVLRGAGDGGQNLDALLPLSDPATHALPRAIAGHAGGAGPLRQDEHDVAGAVAVEPRREAQVPPKLLAARDPLDAGLQEPQRLAHLLRASFLPARPAPAAGGGGGH